MRKKYFIKLGIYIFIISLSVIYFHPCFVFAQILTGDVWFVPSEIIILTNTQFTTEVHVNSGVQKIAAYGFEVHFDQNIVAVDTTQGNNGVTAGPDGFVAAVNSEDPGILIFNGYDTSGKGPGSDLNVLTIHWSSGMTTGTTPLNLRVTTLTDETTATIGDIPRDLDGSVTVNDAEMGDANKDGSVDIVDALIIAQYYVGTNPANFHTDVSDVDHSGQIDIVDALLVAQFYVDLLPALPTPTPSPSPTPTPVTPGITPENWVEVNNFIQINASQANRFFENGFVVLSNSKSNTLSQVYTALSGAERVPPFITTDALLHIFHITYAHMSEIIEKNELINRMKTLLGNVNLEVMTEYNNIPADKPFIKQAALKLWIYSAVADSLINGETSISGSDVVPIEASVNDILGRIYACAPPESGSDEDYTHYKPRGHYKGDTELENYFRAKTWLERQYFHFADETESAASAIMGYVLTHNQTLLDSWDSIHTFLSALINPAQGLNPKDINQAMGILFSTYNTDKYFLLEEAANRTILMDYLLTESDPDAQYAMFMDTGFSMDIDAMDSTVGPNNVTGRFMPNSLDAAATVFNSGAAYDEHQSEMATYTDGLSLQQAIENLIIEYNQMPESEWTQSIYNSMLYAIRALSDNPNGVVPEFMQNTPWQREKLNTQLAAWTELHNDNIIYSPVEPTPTPTPTSTPTSTPLPETPTPTPQPDTPTPEPITDPPGTSTPSPPPETPAPTSPPVTDKVKAEYKCSAPSADSNQIKPRLNIINTVSAAIPLNEMTIRYYYTKEGDAPEEFHVDYAAVGASNVTGEFYDGYVEIGFTADAGELPFTGETGEISIRINKTDWSNYDQSDDYSFDGTVTYYTEWIYVTVYQNGTKIWGVEPGIPIITDPPTGTPTPIPTPTPTVTPTPVPKRGFVEPYPDFYSRIKTMCQKAMDAITEAGFMTIHLDKFSEIYTWADTFEIYSNIILADNAFTTEEEEYMKDWGYEIDYFFTDPAFVPESNAKSHVVTDIYTYEDRVLHEAMGKLHPIIILYKEPGKESLFAAVGYTMSYYEFEETDYNRVNDDEWETMLNSSPPDRPLWTDGYIEN